MDDKNKVEAYKALEEARTRWEAVKAEKGEPSVEDRKALDDALDAVEQYEAKARDDERDAKLAKIEATYAAQAQALEDDAKGILQPVTPEQARGKDASSPEYVKAFADYARGKDGAEQVLKEFKADGAVGADGTGGYLVPVILWNQLWVDKSAGYPLIDLVTTYNISVGNVLHIDQAYSHGTMTEVGEAGTPSAADETYTQGTITVYKGQRISKVSDESLTDPAFDVASHLTGILARVTAEWENARLTVGTGSNQAQGIVTGVYATSGQRVTGATGQASSIGADDVFTVLHKVSAQYRANAVWQANDDTVRILRTLKDANGVYLWQQGLQAGEPSTLAGYPIITNPDVAAMSANAKSLLFADPAGHVRVLGNGGALEILRLNELYAGTGQVGFRATRRFGAGFMAPSTSGAIWVNSAS